MYLGIRGHFKSKERDGNAAPIWKGKYRESVLGSASVSVAIQEPPKCNRSLQVSVDSDHGYLALTILAIFAPGGYIQLAEGNSDNFEAD